MLNFKINMFLLELVCNSNHNLKVKDCFIIAKIKLSIFTQKKLSSKYSIFHTIR